VTGPRAWLAEPLVHFLVLGAALFAVFALVGRSATPGANRVIVTMGTIDSLRQSWQQTWGRPPTPTELDGLIEEHLREEILGREALALGLDRDDTSASRGDDAAAEAVRLLARLRSGAATDPSALGDPFLMGNAFDRLPGGDVERIFGAAFASSLADVEIGVWSGPLESGYGLHLVRLLARTAGRHPSLDEVRTAVRRDWDAAKRREANAAMLRELRARYVVTFETGAVP
jgi:hypothetical protein